MLIRKVLLPFADDDPAMEYLPDLVERWTWLRAVPEDVRAEPLLAEETAKQREAQRIIEKMQAELDKGASPSWRKCSPRKRLASLRKKGEV